jgi:hypothetical protein
MEKTRIGRKEERENVMEFLIMHSRESKENTSNKFSDQIFIDLNKNIEWRKVKIQELERDNKILGMFLDAESTSLTVKNQVKMNDLLRINYEYGLSNGWDEEEDEVEDEVEEVSESYSTEAKSALSNFLKVLAIKKDKIKKDKQDNWMDMYLNKRHIRQNILFYCVLIILVMTPLLALEKLENSEKLKLKPNSLLIAHQEQQLMIHSGNLEQRAASQLSDELRDALSDSDDDFITIDLRNINLTIDELEFFQKIKSRERLKLTTNSKTHNNII